MYTWSETFAATYTIANQRFKLRGVAKGVYVPSQNQSK